MKLLLDQHLSRRLVVRLAWAFPGTMHTSDLGLSCADDIAIWHRARIDGFVLVTKDSDYAALSVRFGRPPLVAWLRVPNCDVASLEALLLQSSDRLQAAEADLAVAVIEIRGR